MGGAPARAGQGISTRPARARRLKGRIMGRSMTAGASARFQEAAAPLPADARLWAWGARVLYVGPALNLSAHRNAVAVLAMGLDSPFEVAERPGDPQSGWRSVRSRLIAPDALHHLRCDG